MPNHVKNIVTLEGDTEKIQQMCWTQEGRKFLYELLKENGYIPLCEQEDEDENPCFSD